MLDTFVGKKIHTLKNKQTSKQKQEEDRKSIEKIKCSFWLENLKILKVWGDSHKTKSEDTTLF